MALKASSKYSYQGLSGNVLINCTLLYSCRQSLSQGGNDKDSKGQKGIKHPISIWPEWSDQDIASEKWVCTIHSKKLEKAAVLITCMNLFSTLQPF
jgi:hypothetical protein